jgi:hypothetical protein
LGLEEEEVGWLGLEEEEGTGLPSSYS